MDRHIVNAWSNLGSVAGELYQFPLADTYFEHGRQRSRSNATSTTRACTSLAWQALSHLYQGRWTEAARQPRGGAEPPAGWRRSARIMALIALGRLRARRGDPDVWAVLDEAMDLANQTDTLQRVAPAREARAEAAWLMGDLDRALRRGARRVGPRRAPSPRVARRRAGVLALEGRRRHQRSPPGAAEPFARQIAGALARGRASCGTSGRVRTKRRARWLRATTTRALRAGAGDASNASARARWRRW